MNIPSFDFRHVGIFSVKKIRPDGAVVDCGEHGNLLLDSGLIGLLSGNAYNRIKVGTGNSTPIPAQVQLDALILTGEAPGVGLTGTDEFGSWFGWSGSIQSAEFTENVNISELGLGSGTSASVITRALTVDSMGVPTAITILAGEILVVGYTFRIYRPTPETPAITGSIPITTDGVVSSTDFTSVFDGPYGIPTGQGLVLNITSSVYLLASTATSFTPVRDGSPSLIDGGAQVTLVATRAAGAGATSITRIKTVTTGSVGARIAATFSPAIPVTSDQSVQVRWRVKLLRFEP